MGAAAAKTVGEAAASPGLLIVSRLPGVASEKTDGFGGAFPESELRQLFVANPDGTVGAYKGSTNDVDKAIGEGRKKRDYSRIRGPVLAIRGLVPQPVDAQLRASGYQPKSPEERSDLEAFTRVTAAHLDRWVTILKGAVPDARIVDFPGAGHYVFLTKEADVLREARAFIAAVGAVHATVPV